jgi:hypothetical protein
MARSQPVYIEGMTNQWEPRLDELRFSGILTIDKEEAVKKYQ